MYKTGMIAMFPNSLIQQHNVNRLAFSITMKVVSADSSCSVVWCGARASCAAVSTGCVEASKAGLGRHIAPILECHMAPKVPLGTRSIP
jgi:hypothetical protein